MWVRGCRHRCFGGLAKPAVSRLRAVQSISEATHLLPSQNKQFSLWLCLVAVSSGNVVAVFDENVYLFSLLKFMWALGQFRRGRWAVHKVQCWNARGFASPKVIRGNYQSVKSFTLKSFSEKKLPMRDQKICPVLCQNIFHHPPGNISPSKKSLAYQCKDIGKTLQWKGYRKTIITG